MSGLSITLVVLSAFLHAVRNLLTKRSGDKQLFVWWYEIWAMVFFLPLFVYLAAVKGLPPATGLAVAAASGLIHFFYWLFLSKAYEDGDLSQVYPIMRSAPALVLIVSIIVLNEKVSILGVAGILLVVAGVQAIGMQYPSAHGFMRPFTALATSRSTRFAFLTMVAVTAYSIVDKIGVGYADPFVFNYLLIVFGVAFFTPYIAATKGKSAIMLEWSMNRRSILLNGLIGFVSYSLILVAFTLERVSYIVGLRQLSIVFAVLMGGYILKEKHRTLRLISAGVIFLGAFLITVAK
ncbi:MAG: EamA family transporter [Chitinispirillaceae bacterium]|nr:EamA family transporter [Chitinispirillaceae bacterium]